MKPYDLHPHARPQYAVATHSGCHLTWCDRMLVVRWSNARRQGISMSGSVSYERIRGEDAMETILIVVIAVIVAVAGGAVINPPGAGVR